MEDFILASAQLSGFALPILLTILVCVCLADRFAESRRQRASEVAHSCLSADEVVTQIELAELIRNQARVQAESEKRITAIEKTAAIQFHEIQRSLGRIEGKVESL